MITEASLINSPACVIAVDPGLSGAVAKIGRGGFDLYRDFQTPAQIALTIQKIAKEGRQVDLVSVEAVHAFPGQGVVSVWSFSEATAYAKAALCLTLPTVQAFEVQPQKWQQYWREYFEVGQSQEFDSRDLAGKLFPTYAGLFKRKKDHNSADAALIGAWALDQVQALSASSPMPK